MAASNSDPKSPAPTGGDPRFQYSAITSPSISVAMWDKIAAAVFDPTAGVIGIVKAVVLASFATMYVIVREKLVSAEQLVAKQKYEQGQQSQDGSDATGALPVGVTK